jgi:hypothetical protein
MLVDCPGCAERREKIKAHMKAIAEWVKNPSGSPSPLATKPPPAPQVITRSNKSKTEKSP